MMATSEVSIDVFSDRFRIRSHRSNKNKKDNLLDEADQTEMIVDSGYNLISSCFMLREDNKVVSIVVTNANFTSNLHVLMLTSEQNAKHLIGKVYQHFTETNRLTADDSDPEEIVVTSSSSVVFPEMFFE